MLKKSQTKIPLTQNKVLNAYIRLQVTYLSQAYWQPSFLQLRIGKYQGEYYSRLCFKSNSIDFNLICKSWSPFKAIDNMIIQARDEIFERSYSECRYI